MAVLYQHDFTGTDGVNVTGLSPTVGSALTAVTGNQVVITNRARNGTTSFSRNRTPSAFTPADYMVTMVVRRFSADGAVRVSGRVTGYSPANLYFVEVDNNDIILYKAVAGTVTQLGSTYAFSPTGGVDYTVDLIMSGSSISVRLGGSTIIGPVTDTSLAGPGWADIVMASTTSGSDTTGWHMDQLIVNDTIPSGGASNAPRSQFYHLHGMR